MSQSQMCKKGGQFGNFQALAPTQLNALSRLFVCPHLFLGQVWPFGPLEVYTTRASGHTLKTKGLIRVQNGQAASRDPSVRF